MLQFYGPMLQPWPPPPHSFLLPPAPYCPFEVLGCQMTSGAIRSAEGQGYQRGRLRSSGSFSSQQDQPCLQEQREAKWWWWWWWWMGGCFLLWKPINWRNHWKGVVRECDSLVRRCFPPLPAEVWGCGNSLGPSDWLQVCLGVRGSCLSDVTHRTLLRSWCGINPGTIITPYGCTLSLRFGCWMRN